MRGLAASLVLLAAPVAAEHPVIYTCAGPDPVVVIYSDTGTASVILGASSFDLAQSVTASGAQYRADLGALQVVWWSKGQDGFLILKDRAGREVSRLASDCVAQ
ncbi:MliC family protein [uncultured Roseobacter sp.]|uniref:MliC family protein n=1 Tax=uncultured Roseobacter sp. TaxID=114847 RepID=UPI0026152A1D|nr:MliC family protein [uncultured Roseobacter sp.]